MVSTGARDANRAFVDRPPAVAGGSPEDLNLVLRVIERVDESADCVSLVLTRPGGLVYEAGDWVDLRFPTADLAVGRTYSYSSAPGEQDIRITYRRGITPFKRALDAARAGDPLLITQHGSNGFRRRPRTPSVFIAGGVGIAPFRSMILDAFDRGDPAAMTLVHVNRSRDGAFREELVALAKRRPQLTLHHVATAEDGRLSHKLLRRLVPDLADSGAHVYAAGPPPMVTSTERLLAALGVPSDRVLTDSFTGY